MRGLLVVLFVPVVLVFAVACGGVQAARDAGERVGGEESSGGSGTETKEEVRGEDRSSEPVLDSEWYRDSDGNVVPDFIELENGFDPERDDCVSEQCPGATEGADFFTKRRNALLILDSSGSMAADDGTGRTKMETAKEAISRYSGVSAAAFETGFAVFGHEGDDTEAGKDRSCEEAAELLSPIGGVDPGSFRQTLSRFEPTGWTPIEGALREAEEAFSGHEGEVNRVILVSDGIETCGGDPVAAAEELRESGIEVRVDVVGLGVPDDEAEQLREIAAAGGGEYYDAKTGDDLDEYFREQAEALDQTWDAFTCELRNSTYDTICDQNQCNDATVFRIPEEQRKYDFDSPEYRALRDLSDRISEGLDERQKARDEASDRASELLDQHQELQEQYNRAYQDRYRGL